jgi:hypothetical protein
MPRPLYPTLGDGRVGVKPENTLYQKKKGFIIIKLFYNIEIM